MTVKCNRCGKELGNGEFFWEVSAFLRQITEDKLISTPLCPYVCLCDNCYGGTIRQVLKTDELLFHAMDVARYGIDAINEEK